jgi:hypothetical protein
MIKLPNHLSVHQGSLYDARKGLQHPIRYDYRWHHQGINTTGQLKATLRAGDHASVGGYPLYFRTADGGVLSFQTARNNLRQVLSAIKHQDDFQWRVIWCDTNWEDTQLYDDHTGEPIPSAYGDDDETGA